MEFAFLAGAILFIAWLATRASSRRATIDDTSPLDRMASHAGPPRREESPTLPPPPSEELIEPSLRPLVRELRSDLPFVAAAGARALGESGHPDAAVPLVRALARDHRSVRFAVVEGLLALGQASAASLRESQMKEPDPDLRELMGRVLEQLERAARGLPTASASDLLQMSPELVKDITRELGR
jgi:hypothetical protein